MITDGMNDRPPWRWPILPDPSSPVNAHYIIQRIGKPWLTRCSRNSITYCGLVALSFLQRSAVDALGYISRAEDLTVSSNSLLYRWSCAFFLQFYSLPSRKFSRSRISAPSLIDVASLPIFFSFLFIFFSSNARCIKNLCADSKNGVSKKNGDR